MGSVRTGTTGVLSVRAEIPQQSCQGVRAGTAGGCGAGWRGSSTAGCVRAQRWNGVEEKGAVG